MTSSWELTAIERDAVLRIEALGLLHDLGKLTDEFLKSQASDKQAGFKYEHTLLAKPSASFAAPTKPSTRVMPNDPPVTAEDFIRDWRAMETNASAAPFKVHDFTSPLLAATLTWNGVNYDFAELLLLTRPGKALQLADWVGATGKPMTPALLVGSLHGVAHYEKEGGGAQQPYKNTFAATPFGEETRIAVDTPAGLTTVYGQLPLVLLATLCSTNRQAWLDAMRPYLQRGLADNRRPTNEVSLWDWGYTVASLSKAAAVWILRNGKPPTVNDVPFRTLCLTLDRLEHYSQADKITDMLGVRADLDAGYEKAQAILENEYGCANLFYRDETGFYFLAPDLPLDVELKRRLLACFPPDLRPLITQGERVTAGELDKSKAAASRKLVATARTATLQRSAQPFDTQSDDVDLWTATDVPHFNLDGIWRSERPENAETCSVCGLRPVGYPKDGASQYEVTQLEKWATHEKAWTRHVCRVCLDRRGRRAQDWVESGMQDTVWTDEVADGNGRLALFVGKLDLDGWLDGTLLSTIKVKKTPKNASPARLYRIAESGRAFWKRMNGDVTANVVGTAPYRLALYPPADAVAKLQVRLGDFNAYELTVDGVALSVVWDSGKRKQGDPQTPCFVTAENLAYFVTRWSPKGGYEPGANLDGKLAAMKGRLYEGGLSVREPSAAGEPPGKPYAVTVVDVKQLPAFTPRIPLLAEPGLSMILIPADKAVALAEAVKAEYEAAMGRVRDRLPLNIGLVFFPRRTPIRSVLEAGRAMLEMGRHWTWQRWDVVSATTIGDQRRVKFTNGVTWDVRTTAGDGTTPDAWYPYYVTGAVPVLGQDIPFADLTHVKELPPGPVWVRPSRFDFEFLDVTARTGEIRYDGQAGTRPVHPTRPYRLDDLGNLADLWREFCHLAPAQRHQIVRTILDTRDAWGLKAATAAQDPVFWQFVRDTLGGAAWPSGYWRDLPETKRNELTKAGATGVLADVFELYTQIMKLDGAVINTKPDSTAPQAATQTPQPAAV